MKKLLFFILLLLSCSTAAVTQLSLVGSNEYGRIFDINYDDTIPGKLYAATLGNHIVVSENNGNTWELLFDNFKNNSPELRYPLVLEIRPEYFQRITTHTFLLISA